MKQTFITDNKTYHAEYIETFNGYRLYKAPCDTLDVRYFIGECNGTESELTGISCGLVPVLKFRIIGEE